jgi:putative aminopeptidase FrvX
MTIRELIRELSEADAAPGDESEVRGILRRELKDNVDEIEVDNFGNLVTRKAGLTEEGPKVMIAAHMDEVALRVEYIEHNGLLRFVKTGNIDDRMLSARNVLIKTKRAKIAGVIGMVAPHLLLLGEGDKVVPHQKLSVDIGANSRDEVLGMGVRVGDPITLPSQMFELANGYITCKAVDNRVGCAAMIEIMKSLSKEHHEASVYAVGTVQEEVGFRGAKVVSHRLNPDVGIAVDTTAMHPDDSKPRFMLGGGPIIRLLEQVSEVDGIIVNRKLSDYLIKSAEESNVPYQALVRPFGGTDASVTQLAKNGVLSCSVEVPSRYIHTPVGVFQLNDVRMVCDLIVAFIKSLSKSTVDSLYAF